MRQNLVSMRSRTAVEEETPARGLAEMLSGRLVGQPEAVAAIVPYVQVFQAGLTPAGRPAGVFLLLGPTGTGKTRTVEALAEVLHGSERNLLKVDCGEFQLDHEVAKLIGAPPGYLGHRETQPMLTQHKLNMASSDRSGLSLVLFDEIEKAAPSMTRLLLGVLDKAALRLGDNTTVNFERSLIFLTSNLGSEAMLKQLRPGLGFRPPADRPPADASRKLSSIGEHAARRNFSPEFLNRIDRIITYRPLDEASLSAILDQHIEDFRRHVSARLGAAGFQLEVPPETRAAILRKGSSLEYGARELKRTLQRHLVEPLAALISEGSLAPGSSVRLVFDSQKDRLRIQTAGGGRDHAY